MTEETYLETCRSSMNEEQSRSLAATDNWAHVDRHRVHEDWRRLYEEIAARIGVSAPDSAAVQALIGRHYDIACRFYQPSRQAYIGMSLFYCENAAMKEFHNAFHPDMVAFLKPAIRTYAESQLIR